MAIEMKISDEGLGFFDGGKEVLTMKEAVRDDCVLIELKGSLRSDMEHGFGDELMALASVGMKMLVDFKGVDYISNGCQDMLFKVQQKIEEKEQGGLVLTGVSSKVRENFESTGLSECLFFED